MINKRLKLKVFKGLRICVPWVGCAGNDTGHPKTLRVPTMGCSHKAGVSTWVSLSLPQLWGSRSTLQIKSFRSFAIERGFFQH